MFNAILWEKSILTNQDKFPISVAIGYWPLSRVDPNKSATGSAGVGPMWRCRDQGLTPPETTGGRLQTALRFIYVGCRTYSSFPPHRSLPIMINFIDAYVVGFSALSFYVLKTYFEARAVWKQFRSVVPYSSRRLGRFTLDSFVTQHDSWATHTRQRIFDPWEPYRGDKVHHARCGQRVEGKA